MKPLVCVFAHPDDEAMGPAGTLAQFAKEREVYLLCATDGNASTSPNPSELGKIRRGELTASAAILGIRSVDFLGFNDGELSHNRYFELAHKIEEKVRDYQPDTLLTFEPKGITGHLDHIAVSLATSLVFKNLDFVKTLFYYCETKEMVREAYSDYFIFTPTGFEPEKIDKSVNIAETLEQKKAAIGAHKSQKEDVAKLLRLLEKPGWAVEHFLELKKG